MFDRCLEQYLAYPWASSSSSWQMVREVQNESGPRPHCKRQGQTWTKDRLAPKPLCCHNHHVDVDNHNSWMGDQGTYKGGGGRGKENGCWQGQFQMRCFYPRWPQTRPKNEWHAPSPLRSVLTRAIMTGGETKKGETPPGGARRISRCHSERHRAWKGTLPGSEKPRSPAPKPIWSSGCSCESRFSTSHYKRKLSTLTKKKANFSKYFQLFLVPFQRKSLECQQ